MEVNQKEIMKTAAVQLRGLSTKLKEYVEKEEIAKLAEEIIKKTLGDETLLKLAEYKEKNIEELKIIEKAIELHKTGELNLGSLSQDFSDNGELDALTAFLVEDYNMS